MKRGRKRSSDVWEHFSSPSASNEVICNYCKITLSYCRSTGSLIKHMKQKHPFVSISPEERASTSTMDISTPGESTRSKEAKRKKQKLVETYFHQPVTPNQGKKITNLIFNVIVGDLRPINLVEGEHFRILINNILPGYDLPSRKTFTRIIEEKVVGCKLKIRETLSTAKHISLTSDLWSSIRMQSYISVTAHFVDSSSFQLKNLLLATKEVTESHTGSNIVNWIEAILEEYSITPERIFAIVTDNGTNMVNACKTLSEKHGWRHMRCAAHTLQLCVKDAISLPQVNCAISAGRRLVVFFRQSSKAMSALRDLQQTQPASDQPTQLVLDVPTRWNSTYEMIKRLCGMQWMVRQVISDTSIASSSRASNLELMDSHWLILQNLIGELEPVKAATDFIEGDKYVTIAGLLPFVKGLIEKYSTPAGNRNEVVHEFKAKLCSALKNRFSFILPGQTTTDYDVATWLHPSYKARYFKKPHAIQVKARVEEEVNRSLEPRVNEVPHLSYEVTHRSSSIMEAILNLGVETTPASSDESVSSEADIVAELSSYLKEKACHGAEVLEWWKVKKVTYPHLHMLILKYFCVPGSSASSERSFSSAGLTATSIRSRLTGKHLEAINILHCNKHFL